MSCVYQNHSDIMRFATFKDVGEKFIARIIKMDDEVNI